MRRLVYALTVATLAAAVLASGAWAATVRLAGGADERRLAGIEVPRESVAASAPLRAGAAGESAVSRLALVARVTKRFGATIRALPSPDAGLVTSARCGDAWPVLAVGGGWVKVQTPDGAGWVSGSRVVVSNAPPAVDCSDARDIRPGGYASVALASGCASLHQRPAPDSSMLACVADGHQFAVLDGPFDAGAGDDWFRVSSLATGTAWVLARQLVPN